MGRKGVRCDGGRRVAVSFPLCPGGRGLCLVPRGHPRPCPGREAEVLPNLVRLHCGFPSSPRLSVASSAPPAPGPGPPESLGRRAGLGAHQPAMTFGSGSAQAAPWAAWVAQSSRCPLTRRRPRCWAPRTWMT